MAIGMRMYAMDNDGTMPTSSNIGLTWAANAPGWVCYFYPPGGGTSIEFNQTGVHEVPGPGRESPPRAAVR